MYNTVNSMPKTKEQQRRSDIHGSYKEKDSL